MSRLKNWLSRQLGTGPDGQASDGEPAVNLAAAALLVEVLRADYQVSAAERAQVLASIRGLLGLDAATCQALLELAGQRIDEAHDLYQFTSELNRSWSAQDKRRLLEQLWRVARSDSTVHKYEEHLIRRVADLLHVSHREFIAAKIRSAGQA